MKVILRNKTALLEFSTSELLRMVVLSPEDGGWYLCAAIHSLTINHVDDFNIYGETTLNWLHQSYPEVFKSSEELYRTMGRVPCFLGNFWFKDTPKGIEFCRRFYNIDCQKERRVDLLQQLINQFGDKTSRVEITA